MPSFAADEPDRMAYTTADSPLTDDQSRFPTIGKLSMPGLIQIDGLTNGVSLSPDEPTLNGDHSSAKPPVNYGKANGLMASEKSDMNQPVGSTAGPGDASAQGESGSTTDSAVARRSRAESDKHSMAPSMTSSPASLKQKPNVTSNGDFGSKAKASAPPASTEHTDRSSNSIKPSTAPKGRSSTEDGSQSATPNVSGPSYVPASTHAVSNIASASASASTLPAGPPIGNRLQQRHTLEVPKVSTSSRQSRDMVRASGSDEIAVASGRFSPTTPTRRRASLSLGRKPTRSMQSDMLLEDIPQDEDAARWAEHIRQKRASRRKRKEDEDDDRVVVGTKVDQNHVNWVTAYNMLTGIRCTVSRTNAKLDKEVTDADFDACHKFSFDITGNELTPSAKYDFKFKDYAPWVFRNLRQIFMLDPADYLMSLTSKYILSELGSPGKSGSFFYFSRDYKYIIKTIHHAEHKFFRRILRQYYNHVKNNPNTLLSQFYGLHRVKIPYGRKIHFVVMNNLFPPHRDIHRTFDLKGSTIGRDLKEEDLENNPRATLKDLNWLRRNLHLEFGPNKKKTFIEQMERDVALLQKLKIMDYSLLIGIHDLTRGNEDNLRDKTLKIFQPGGDETAQNLLMRTPSKLENERKAKELRMTLKSQKPIPMQQATARMPEELLAERSQFYFYSDDGGFRATHEDDSPGEEIYYLGIIDCLTYYSFIKRGEHFFKGFTADKDQISAIPPDRYGDRFIRFISGITKTRERAEMEAAAGMGPAASMDGHVEDPRLSGMSARLTATDKAGTAAGGEKQAENATRHGGRSGVGGDEDAPSRPISSVRSPSADRGGDHGATLPVVEEAAESASVGGRSARSAEPSARPAPYPDGMLDEDGHDEEKAKQEQHREYLGIDNPETEKGNWATLSSGNNHSVTSTVPASS